MIRTPVRASKETVMVTARDGTLIDLNHCGPTSVSLDERRWFVDHIFKGNALEMGSHLGGSTSFLAHVAAHVCSVDWHQGDSTVGWGSTYGEFKLCLESFGVADKVCVHVGRFEDVLTGGSHVKESFYDLVFLDGEHTKESVCRDLRLIFANVSTPLIAVHDSGLYQTDAGIEAGIDGTNWQIIDKVDTLAILRRVA